jgi:dipeptidyl aminopeptidase/acylaminoacyl peptidase
MKKSIFVFLCLGLILIAVGFYFNGRQTLKIISPLGKQKKLQQEKVKPLFKYQYPQLKKRGGIASNIKLEEIIKEENKFTQYLFKFNSEGRTVSGLANIPKQDKKFPVIVMLRGYVDQEIYKTGVGTRPAGEFYAENGYLTLAPDFLGYGESDNPPNNVWEERFLRPVTVLDLLASIKSLDQAEQDKVYLWGHSNGGMIALSVLEMVDKQYPTTLWAPVTQFFPYDVLYYTYEFDDGGKALRKSLAEFEQEYDTNKYSFTNYLELIDSPLQLHQGLDDQYIPVFWSDQFVEKLNNQDLEVNYFKYPQTDHNLRGSWQTVVKRDLQFFQEHQ